MTTDNLDITRLKLTLRCIRYTERTASEFKCSMPIECQKKIIHSENYGMVEFICVIYLLFANNNNLRKNFYIVTFKDGWREGNRASLRAFGLVYPQNNNRWWERNVMHSPQKRVPIKDIVFSKQPIDLAVISSYEENKIIGWLFSLWEQTDPGFWSFKILHTFPESILFLGG